MTPIIDLVVGFVPPSVGSKLVGAAVVFLSLAGRVVIESISTGEVLLINVTDEEFESVFSTYEQYITYLLYVLFSLWLPNL